MKINFGSVKKSARSAMVLTVGVVAVGCMKTTIPAGEVDRSPLIVDEAMQTRQWPLSVARFQNGETEGWPTGFVLKHNPDAPPWTPVVTDTALFMANVVAMPVGYAFTPMWTHVIYPFDVIPPSFNGMPPLPPPQP